MSFDKLASGVLRSGSLKLAMPKKSKREKMLADIRRRVRTERVLIASPPASTIQAHESTFRFTAPVQSKRQETQMATDTSELTAIKKDLTKTVILAAVAVAAELVLFLFGKGKI